jgi:hypothetical protein
MASRKTAPLSAGLLVRKGEATPATGNESPAPTHTPPQPAGTKTIALTVKLDPERYHKLIAYGARFTPRRSNQQIIVAALDAYLERES